MPSGNGIKSLLLACMVKAIDKPLHRENDWDLSDKENRGGGGGGMGLGLSWMEVLHGPFGD